MTKNNKNIVFVGTKPMMHYLNAAQFSLKRNNKIKICARGKNISRAVDVVEILEKRFMKDEIEKVSILTDSEKFDSREDPNKKINVSTIEIIIRNKLFPEGKKDL